MFALVARELAGANQVGGDVRLDVIPKARVDGWTHLVGEHER